MTDQQTKALYIAQRCVAAGMTIAGATGVITNMQHESVFSPINVEDRYHADTKQSDEYYTHIVDTNPSYDFANDGGRHYGYGLCQWTFPTRKTELRKVCREKGVSIGNRDTQIDFMFKELQRDFPVVWKALTTSNSAYNCTWQFCRWFENPANPEATAEYRANQSAPWYDFLVVHIKDDVPVDPEPQPQPEPEPQKDELVLRTIDHNCNGFNEVYLLQSLLLCRGYEVIVSGVWDYELTDCVKVFQRHNGLDADGVVGKNTWNKLMERNGG